MYFIRKFNPEIHHRKSIRLSGYKINQKRAFFLRPIFVISPKKKKVAGEGLSRDRISLFPS